jgi:hypothetical protein
MKIVKSGPYRGQLYKLTVRQTSFPRWKTVILYDNADMLGAVRDVREADL